MITIILCVVYVSFIGIGLPNAIFGVAWPVMYEELNLPLSAANYINILVPGCTAVSGLFSARITNRFGITRVTFGGSCLIGLTLLGFSVSRNILHLSLCAVSLGLVTGVLDAALNNYVSLHYKPIHMNLLHCFFGIGSSLSLYLMSSMLENSNWHNGYHTVALFQFGIATIILLVFPTWNKLQVSEKKEATVIQHRTFSIIEMLRIPALRLTWSICLTTSAIGGVYNAWGASYLVMVYNFGAEDAAKVIAIFTIGMTLGRLCSGFLADKISEWHMFYLCSGITLISLIMLFIPFPKIIVMAIFVLGFGNGPIYPTMLQLAPRCFGKDVSASVIGSQMAFAYIGIMTAPSIFGFIAQESIELFPVYISLFVGLMVLSIFVFDLRKGR